MADEAFALLWSRKGGPELVALHGMFGGTTLALDEIRTLLEIASPDLRAAVLAAQQVGLVESGADRVTFLAFGPGSAQQGRLDWCLEEHQAALTELSRRLQTVMLVRYLSAPPGVPA